VFCQKGIDDLAQHFLAKAGIYAVRRVKESDMEKLARATGGQIVSKIRELAGAELGSAKLVYEKKVGDEDWTFVTGCKNPRSVSVLLRGGTEHVVDEMERSLEDAVSAVAVAVEDGKYLVGGGAAFAELAMALRDHATTIGGREQLAIEAFANGLDIVPRSLAENAGMDPIDTLIDLRSAHKQKKRSTGVDVLAGKVADLEPKGIFEPIRVVRQAIASATDAAVMILRIDDVIASKEPKPSAKGPGGEDHGGMGGDFD